MQRKFAVRPKNGEIVDGAEVSLALEDVLTSAVESSIGHPWKGVPGSYGSGFVGRPLKRKWYHRPGAEYPYEELCKVSYHGVSVDFTVYDQDDIPLVKRLADRLAEMLGCRLELKLRPIGRQQDTKIATKGDPFA